MQTNDIVYVDEINDETKLDVTFSREVHNVYALDGSLVSTGEEDFVTIKTPGDNTNVVHEVVNEMHKARFPRKWAAYQNNQTFGGTPIEEWDDLSDALKAQFKIQGFRYIEQIANANHDAFNKIMGGNTWKAKALTFLSKSKAEESATIKQQAEEIQALKEQMAQLMTIAKAAVKPPTVKTG